MQYFWRVLDVHGEGRLTVATISLFFRDVARVLKEGGFETPNTEDVKVQQYVAQTCFLWPVLDILLPLVFFGRGG